MFQKTNPWSSGKCVRFGAGSSILGLVLPRWSLTGLVSYQDLEISTVAFLPGARCVEKLQETQTKLYKLLCSVGQTNTKHMYCSSN